MKFQFLDTSRHLKKKKRQNNVTKMDLLRNLTASSNIKDTSKEADQRRADAEFSTRMSVEARMLQERDLTNGKARGWAWQTRVEFDKGVHHPYSNYCGYLRNDTSDFWPEKDTKALKEMKWQKKL